MANSRAPAVVWKRERDKDTGGGDVVEEGGRNWWRYVEKEEEEEVLQETESDVLYTDKDRRDKRIKGYKDMEGRFDRDFEKGEKCEGEQLL